MKQKTLFLIANPEFDKRFDNGISRLYQIFCIGAGYNLEIINPEFLKNFVPDKEHPQILLIAGGDGTIHRVINAISEDRIKKYIFGIIPGGTANEFARSLSIPISLNKSAELIINPRKIYYQHIGVINGDCRFVTGLLYGLADYVLRITPTMAKHLLGHAAFYLGLLKFLFKLLEQNKDISEEFLINNQKHFTNYLLINNASLKSKNISSQEIKNENKDLFSLIFVHSRLSFLKFLELMLKSQFQYHILDDPALYYEQLQKITLEFEGKLNFLIDGDPYILASPLNIEFYKDPIAVIAG